MFLVTISILLMLMSSLAAAISFAASFSVGSRVLMPYTPLAVCLLLFGMAVWIVRSALQRGPDARIRVAQIALGIIVFLVMPLSLVTEFMAWFVAVPAPSLMFVFVWALMTLAAVGSLVRRRQEWKQAVITHLPVRGGDPWGAMAILVVCAVPTTLAGSVFVSCYQTGAASIPLGGLTVSGILAMFTATCMAFITKSAEPASPAA